MAQTAITIRVLYNAIDIIVYPKDPQTLTSNAGSLAQEHSLRTMLDVFPNHTAKWKLWVTRMRPLKVRSHVTVGANPKYHSVAAK